MFERLGDFRINGEVAPKLMRQRRAWAPVNLQAWPANPVRSARYFPRQASDRSSPTPPPQSSGRRLPRKVRDDSPHFDAARTLSRYASAIPHGL